MAAPCGSPPAQTATAGITLTVNAGHNFAILGGYRSLKVDYTSDTDTANMRMKGFYWGGNVRF